MVTTGLFFGSVFVSDAQAQTEDQIASALADLSEAYGSSVDTEEQAKEICSQEEYLTICAEIGRQNNLFDDDHLEQVDALLDELKGDLVEDLISCQNEECLLGVADSLAARIASSNPELVNRLDLTPEKVEEKRDTYTVVRNVGDELGVDYEICRNMNPDTASVDLLRSCA